MAFKAKNGKDVIAWVSVTCPYCGNNEQVEVTELDKTGKHIVRCAKCNERIPVDTTPPGVKEASVIEAGVNVNDKAK